MESIFFVHMDHIVFFFLFLVSCFNFSRPGFDLLIFFMLSDSEHYMRRSNEDEESIPPALKSLMTTVGDHCELRSSDCSLEKHNFDGEGDPLAVFNVLDALLKGSLDRLKTMR